MSKYIRVNGKVYKAVDADREEFRKSLEFERSVSFLKDAAANSGYYQIPDLPRMKEALDVAVPGAYSSIQQAATAWKRAYLKLQKAASKF